MDATAFSFTTILVLIFVGFVPSQATKCTTENLRHCTWSGQAIGCPMFQHLQECLEKMEQNCTDDALAVELKDNMNYARLEGDLCTGLEDGECFHSAWLNCESKVPSLELHNLVVGTEKGKKTHCDEYTNKMSSFKMCLDDLKPKCTSTDPSSRIEQYRKWAADNLKNCD